MAHQIVSGAPADILIAAGEFPVKYLEARGFVSNKTAVPRVYKNNNIEIIGNPKFDLSKSDAVL